MKVPRSRDNPRGATRTTRAAWCAYEDASPIAFLRAAPKHHRRAGKTTMVKLQVLSPGRIGEGRDEGRRCQPRLAFAQQTPLRHPGGKIDWGGQQFGLFQVEDILCSLHCSSAPQPLADLKKGRAQHRQDALEMEDGVINLGGVALPDAQQPARKVATRSTQRAHQDLCLRPSTSREPQARGCRCRERGPPGWPDWELPVSR